MKVLAPFDGTPFSESTLPLLKRLTALTGTEVVLLRVAHEPSGRRMRGIRRSYTNVGQTGSTPVLVEVPQGGYAETSEQAVERMLHEMQNYLATLASQLSDSAKIHIEAHLHDSAAEAVIEQAKEDNPDVIVMATHSKGAIKRALFGSTTEAVIRSGVAPVLVVHPAGD